MEFYHNCTWRLNLVRRVLYSSTGLQYRARLFAAAFSSMNWSSLRSECASFLTTLQESLIARNWWSPFQRENRRIDSTTHVFSAMLHSHPPRNFLFLKLKSVSRSTNSNWTCQKLTHQNDSENEHHNAWVQELTAEMWEQQVLSTAWSICAFTDFSKFSSKR